MAKGQAQIMTRNAVTGDQQEIVFEEEDGITMISIRDWNNGDVLFETEFNGTLDEIKEQLP